MDKSAFDFPRTKDGKIDTEKFIEMIKEKNKEQKEKINKIELEYVDEEDNSRFEDLYQAQMAEIDIPSIDEFGEVKGAKIPLHQHNLSIRNKYEKFDKMRNLNNSFRSYGNWDWYADNRKEFYEQAKFMVDFEDDYNKIVPFNYRASYKTMDNEQLRCYFSWRTKVRNKIVIDVPYNYINIYINELINFIGVLSFQDGVDKLIFLWENYRHDHKVLDKEMPSRIKDFYINYSNNENYHDIRNLFPIKEISNENTIKELLEYNYDNKLSFFNRISTYKIINSSFYNQERHQLIENCVGYVFGYLKDYFKNYKINMNKLILSKLSTDYWQPFMDDLYFFPNEESGRNISIDDIEFYTKNGKLWHREVTTCYYNNGFIGYVLKIIETKMRLILKSKYRLHPNTNMLTYKFYGSRKTYRIVCSSEFFNFIEKKVVDYFIKNKKIILKPQPKSIEITIDPSKFNRIRDNAAIIQEKLIVDEVDDVEINEEIDFDNKKNSNNNETFNEIEVQFLNLLINHADISQLNEFAMKNNSLLEVLVEGINEKSLDLINDSLIVIEDEVYIYPDYYEFIKKKLEEENHE